MERGWCLGSQAFRAEMLASASERVEANHYGAERRKIREARDRRLVQEGLRELGWTKAELSRRAKGDKFKVSPARRLRPETTMTLVRPVKNHCTQ